MWGPIVGDQPTREQILITIAAALAAMVWALEAYGTGWVGWLMALFAVDWGAGAVSLLFASTQAWWRGEPGFSRWFLPTHLLEIPVVWWLSGGDVGFWILLAALGAKLALFEAGRARPPRG